MPRSYAHAKGVYERFGSRLTKLTGIYRAEDGCGGCTRIAMNSKAQKEWEALDDENVLSLIHI